MSPTPPRLELVLLEGLGPLRGRCEQQRDAQQQARRGARSPAERHGCF
jgi:hypothetical protein